MFETRNRAVGGPDLTRDNGFSAWLGAHPGRFLDLELGYTRSVHFRLDTVFFRLGFNVSSAIKKARGR